MLTVGGIIGGGLRLVRDRPVSTLVWGFVYMAITAAGMVAVFLPFFQMTSMAAAGQGVPPDPTAMIRLMGLMYLFYFGVFVVLTILLAAGVRAVLRPEDRAFAYIRIGMDELRLVALMLLLVIGMFVLMMILGILLAIVLAATGVLSGGVGSGGGVARPGVTFILMMILIYAVPIYFLVRLSPALALTMIREKIVIGEAWRLTSGNFWKVFAGYFVLNVMLFVVYIAIVFAVLVPVMATIGQGTSPAAITGILQGHIGSGLLSIMVGGGVVLAVLSGIGIAFWSGGIAAATNGLLGTTETDYAETFA